MPRVPSYDNLRVMPAAVPGAQFSGAGVQTNPMVEQAVSRAPRPTQMPGLNTPDPGAPLKAAGQTMSAVGSKMLDFELEELKQINATRINAALNQALEVEMRLSYDKEVGYTNQRGLSAIERESGKPLADEYGEIYQKEIEAISAGLGNEYQRAAFTDAANKRLLQLRESATRHEAGEFRTYAESVNEGVIANRLQLIGFNYNNPQVIDGAVRSIKAATYELGKLSGKSAEWIEAKQREAVSNAHKLALSTALEKNDITYADAYLRKYGKQMEADDLLQATGLITKEMDWRVGTSAATEVMGRWAPKIVPGDMDRLTNIVLAMESGGRRYDAGGGLLESPKGAKGEMQVMDGTNVDPGYGVKPAADDSPEERARVGRDYLAAMVREYDGDVSKALAAYNWGPGNLDKAVKEHGPNWLQAAPEETRSYVERGVREFGAGAGRGKRPSLAEIKADLRGDPMLAGNPARLKAAEEAAEKQYRDIEAAEKQATDEALDTAYRGLYANGGNMGALPVSVRAMIPGDKLSAVMGFADTVRKSGGAVHNPEAWAQVLSMPRESLAAMSPIEFFREFRPHLDDAHLEKGYALLNDARGEVGTDAKHLEVITTANRVKKAAIDAGLLPATGKANDNEVKAFAQFERLVDDRVRQFEATDLQGKRKANSAELQQIIDGTLMDKVFVSRTGWIDREVIAGLAAPEDLTRAYVNVGGQEVRVAQIPANQRAVIASKLQSRGLPVTEQRIAELWVAAGRPQ